MVTALIGATGLIGKIIRKNFNVDFLFDSKNIVQAKNQRFDLVYCCAPSGNRLVANQHPAEDLENIQNLISILKTVDIQRLVLVSTVDTQHDPNSPYGGNRLLLEQFAKSLANHHVVRLCSLIDESISKNVLFDLKHQMYLESVNLEQTMHWYRLIDLPYHLNAIIANNINDVNLVSEPIQTQEITNMFFKHLNLSTHRSSKPYNLTCDHNSLCQANSKYVYSKHQIFNFMQQYLDD